MFLFQKCVKTNVEEIQSKICITIVSILFLILRCILNYLNNKFGPCDHYLSENSPIDCPNLAERLQHFADMKMEGLAVIKSKTNCTLLCHRIEHSNILIGTQDAHILFPGTFRLYTLTTRNDSSKLFSQNFLN